MSFRWLALCALVSMSAACSSPRTAASVLEAAQQAMGNPTSLQYSGTGMNAFVGQALTAGEAWPRRDLSGYVRTIDYDKRASREELTFAMETFGGRQQTQVVAGDAAWNVGPTGPVPQPAQAEERQLLIWVTPHGFIKGAMAAGNATLGGTETAPEITFTALGKYTVTGTLDANNLVTRVATKVASPVEGDMDLVATYADYKDYGGVQVPGKIDIQQGGHPAWELAITSATPNAPLDLPVPDAVKSATVPPVQVTSTQMAPGVWHLAGGSHHSVVVEFADSFAVVEAPLTEARSMAVLAEARKLVPNKPLSHVVTTHHHFDHTGGLRTYAAEGATIVTHASNVPYFQRVLVAPATISPDAQSKAQKTPTFQGVTDRFEFGDAKQKVQVVATSGDAHTNEYTHAYLPGPRILVEGDAYSPGPADAPPPATPNPNSVKLYDDIQMLKLNVATIAPIHGRGPVPIAELRKFIGRR
jgi:glyoxylase-like metal-dependent hydrolase (beta-lactamase superfamily II)